MTWKLRFRLQGLESGSKKGMTKGHIGAVEGSCVRLYWDFLRNLQ